VHRSIKRPQSRPALRPINQSNSYPCVGVPSRDMSGRDLERADECVPKREAVAEVDCASRKLSGQPDPGDVPITGNSLPTTHLDRVPVFGRGAFPPPADLVTSAPGAAFILELCVIGETGDNRVGVASLGRPQVSRNSGWKVESCPIEVDRSPRIGTPSPSNSSRWRCPLGMLPSARMTRCHGRSSCVVASTRPTSRGASGSSSP